MKRRVVMVCGGAGFIGSHFNDLLLTRWPDAELIVYDALTYAGNLANLAHLPPERFVFVPGRVQDPVGVAGTIQGYGVTHIVNFAAESHNDRSLQDAGTFVQTDVAGVHTLLEATRRYGVERLLHVSTDEVYGSATTGAFSESSPLLPNTPYSASKAGGDLQARAAWVSYRTPVVITRGGNNYGPRQFPEKLIPFFVVRLLMGKKVPLYGTGEHSREWIHVADHCEAILTALEQGVNGEVYNAGDDNERTNREIVRILLEETGRDETFIRSIPDPRQGAHDHRYRMETGKLRALGWQPTRNFEQELRATVRWYRENEAWWRPLVQDPAYQAFVASFYGTALGPDL